MDFLCDLLVLLIILVDKGQELVSVFINFLKIASPTHQFLQTELRVLGHNRGLIEELGGKRIVKGLLHLVHGQLFRW